MTKTQLIIGIFIIAVPIIVIVIALCSAAKQADDEIEVMEPDDLKD